MLESNLDSVFKIVRLTEKLKSETQKPPGHSLVRSFGPRWRSNEGCRFSSAGAEFTHQYRYRSA